MFTSNVASHANHIRSAPLSHSSHFARLRTAVRVTRRKLTTLNAADTSNKTSVLRIVLLQYHPVFLSGMMASQENSFGTQAYSLGVSLDETPFL